MNLNRLDPEQIGLKILELTRSGWPVTRAADAVIGAAERGHERAAERSPGDAYPDGSIEHRSAA